MSVQAYKQKILDSIAAKPELAGLSTSQVAEWLALVNSVASAQYTMEELWAIYSAELELKGQQANVGTIAWFADKALEWQDGDPLVVINGAAGYATIDATKRLVKYVAVEEREDFVILKVAKDVGGEYVPLTAGTNQELARFISYMNKRKIPGIKTAYISQQADLVKLVASVQYAGTLIVDDVKAAVELAITNHLKNIAQFTDPRRRLNINLLRDAIEAVELLEEGSTQIGSLSVKPTGVTSVNVTLDYNPVSGHYAVDPDWPLDTTITYIPV